MVDQPTFCDEVRRELRAKMERDQFGQCELAARIGISSNVLNLFLRKERDIKISSLEKMAHFVGVRWIEVPEQLTMRR